MSLTFISDAGTGWNIMESMHIHQMLVGDVDVGREERPSTYHLISTLIDVTSSTCSFRHLKPPEFQSGCCISCLFLRPSSTRSSQEGTLRLRLSVHGDHFPGPDDGEIVTMPKHGDRPSAHFAAWDETPLEDVRFVVLHASPGKLYRVHGDSGAEMG